MSTPSKKITVQNQTVETAWIITRNATPVVTFRDKKAAELFMEKMKDNEAFYHLEPCPIIF